MRPICNEAITTVTYTQETCSEIPSIKSIINLHQLSSSTPVFQKYSQLTSSVWVSCAELTGLLTVHVYCPLSPLSTGLMDSVLFSSLKVVLSLGDRGRPPFVHALVMMVPWPSQVKVTELLPAMRVPPELMMGEEDAFAVRESFRQSMF